MRRGSLRTVYARTLTFGMFGILRMTTSDSRKTSFRNIQEYSGYRRFCKICSGLFRITPTSAILVVSRLFRIIQDYSGLHGLWHGDPDGCGKTRHRAFAAYPSQGASSSSMAPGPETVARKMLSDMETMMVALSRLSFQSLRGGKHACAAFCPKSCASMRAQQVLSCVHVRTRACVHACRLARASCFAGQSLMEDTT